MTDSTDTTSTPPWGDDFDAARAWRSAERSSFAFARSPRTFCRSVQARETAESALSDADPEGKLTAAEKRAADVERSLWTERALRKHEIDEELVEFLSGDTEEAILAKAEKLSKVRKPDAEKPEAAAEKDAEKPSPEGDLQSRPAPNLTPGHGGDTPAPFDPEAIASAARKARA
jgi:hypothetical protein